MLPAIAPVHYPESDGKPMAENTLQFQWIVMIQGNLDLLFRANPNVFVGGDNFIYPQEGSPSICIAPDVYVAFGRPKGHRGSYKVWEEGGLFPQVVFEVLSPGNTDGEMTTKRQFYRKWGVEEFYVIDPDANAIEGWIREESRFVKIKTFSTFVSPRLGIRFEKIDGELVVLLPNAERFLTFLELGEDREEIKAQLEYSEGQLESTREQLETTREHLESTEEKLSQTERLLKLEAEKRARLEARLRELGLDPDAME